MLSVAELIDTLWNVNKSVMPVLAPAIAELIDTLWNVNLFSLSKCGQL